MVAEHQTESLPPSSGSGSSVLEESLKNQRVLITPHALTAPPTNTATSPAPKTKQLPLPLPSSAPTAVLPPDARCYIASLYRAEVDLAREVASRSIRASQYPSWVQYKAESSQLPPSATSADGDPMKGPVRGDSLIGLTRLQKAAVHLASSAPIMLLTGA